MVISEMEAALSFLRKAYADNPRHGDPDYWDWHYVQAPGIEANELPIWLAKSGTRIAGQLATLPVQLHVGERTVKALWVLDWIVDSDFRRQGIGKKLAMAAEEYSPYLLGVNTDQQHAPKLLLGLNWVKVSMIPRFHKILFPGAAFSEISKVPGLGKVLDLAFKPVRTRSVKSSGGFGETRLLESFGPAFDELWRESQGQWKCSTSRTAKVLEWQFASQPGKKFDILGYFEKDKLLGYAVLFFRKPNAGGAISKAAISDICYHPKNPMATVDSMLSGALRLAIERKAGGLVTDAIDPLLENRLRHFGFSRVRSALQLMVKAPEDRELLYDRDNWFLTRGDSDISIFEHSNI